MNSETPPLEDLDPKLSAFRVYWESLKTGNEIVPHYGRFDAVDIPRLLPHIWLVDVERNPVRFRFRLVGQVLVDAGAVAKAGSYLDELFPAELVEDTINFFRPAFEDGKPVWRRGTPRLAHSRYVTDLQMISTPYSTNGREIDLLCNCTVYTWRK